MQTVTRSSTETHIRTRSSTETHIRTGSSPDTHKDWRTSVVVVINQCRLLVD